MSVVLEWVLDEAEVNADINRIALVMSAPKTVGLCL